MEQKIDDLARYFVAPLNHSETKVAIGTILFDILFLIAILLFSSREEVFLNIITLSVVGLVVGFWPSRDAIKTCWAIYQNSAPFLSTRVPFGTVLSARPSGDGWVHWYYPDGSRVFSDPLDDKLAWEQTQGTPFPVDQSA